MKKTLSIKTKMDTPPGQLIDAQRFNNTEQQAYEAKQSADRANTLADQNAGIILALIVGALVIAGVAIAALLN